jgi:hypothetical protein
LKQIVLEDRHVLVLVSSVHNFGNSHSPHNVNLKYICLNKTGNRQQKWYKYSVPYRYNYTVKLKWKYCVYFGNNYMVKRKWKYCVHFGNNYTVKQNYCVHFGNNYKVKQEIVPLECQVALIYFHWPWRHLEGWCGQYYAWLLLYPRIPLASKFCGCINMGPPDPIPTHVGPETRIRGRAGIQVERQTWSLYHVTKLDVSGQSAQI